MQHMDPATGNMVDDDQQPDPNAGGLAGQQQAAAAMSPLPIPPQGPTATPGEPTMISPAAAEAPGVDVPPPAAPGGLQLPEPSLSLPGAPQGPTLTLPTDPPTGTGDDLIPAPVPKDPDAALSPSSEPAAGSDEGPAETIEGRNKQLADIAKEQIDTRKAQAEDEKAQANLQAAALKDKAEQAAATKKALDEVSRGAENRLAARRATHEADQQKLQELGAKDAWGDNATGLKILAGIALALGGRRAAPYIIGASNGFIANKKEAIAAQAEKAKASGEDVDKVRTEANDQIQSLNVRAAAGLEATASRLEAEKAAQGATKAQIAADSDIQEIRKAAIDARQKADIAAHKQAEADAKEEKMKLKIDADTRLSKLRGDQIAKKMAGGGPGGPSKKELRAEAKDKRDDERLNLSGATALDREMKDATKDLTQKGGLIEQQQHLDSSMRKLAAGEQNPVEWTNAIDAAIRTNTGRAAIKAQYDLYTHHAGGTAAKFEDWLEQAKTGNIGATYKRNLLGSFKSSLAELQREGGEQEKNFRETYENDIRLKNNPTAQAAFFAHHKNVFGKLHGGETIGGSGTTKPAASEAPPSAPAQADPLVAKSKKAISDPNAPPAAKAAAIKYLKSKGLNSAGDLVL